MYHFSENILYTIELTDNKKFLTDNQQNLYAETEIVQTGNQFLEIMLINLKCQLSRECLQTENKQLQQMGKEELEGWVNAD